MRGRPRTRQKNIPFKHTLWPLPLLLDWPFFYLYVHRFIYFLWPIRSFWFFKITMGGDSASDRLSFLVTWDDPLSGLTRCSVSFESFYLWNCIFVIQAVLPDVQPWRLHSRDEWQQKQEDFLEENSHNWGLRVPSGFDHNPLFRLKGKTFILATHCCYFHGGFKLLTTGMKYNSMLIQISQLSLDK